MQQFTGIYALSQSFAAVEEALRDSTCSIAEHAHAVCALWLFAVGLTALAALAGCLSPVPTWGELSGAITRRLVHTRQPSTGRKGRRS